MNKYYQIVIDFLGWEWFDSSWKSFQKKRKKYPQDSLDPEVTQLEIQLHPLLKEVFRHQDLSFDTLDFTRIPQKCLADIMLTYLGRDLELLCKEIKQRGNKIKKSLQDAIKYEGHRFTLLVAAGYKLLNYKIEFIPSSSRKGKTADLKVVDMQDRKYLIECKQRNQRLSDRQRITFLARIAEKIFPLLRTFNYSDILINIEAKGSFNDVGSLISELTRRISTGNFNEFQSKQNIIKIVFARISKNLQIRNLLINSGHLQGKPATTTTPDYFFTSEGNNAIFLNKDVDPDFLPQNVYDLLEDANKKNRNRERLLVYFDVGTGMGEWCETLALQIKRKFKENKNAYPNIAGVVICHTLPEIDLDRKVIFNPRLFMVGFKSRLGGLPKNLNLFGAQGKSGLDGYLIQ